MWNIQLEKEEVQKTSQAEIEIGEAISAAIANPDCLMREEDREEAERRGRVEMRDDKLDAAKRTVDNLVFAATDKKTPKDAFEEGRRVGKLLFWRAIDSKDKYVDSLIFLDSLMPKCLFPRLCQTALKQENPVVALCFVGGIQRVYRKLARRTGLPSSKRGSHQGGRGLCLVIDGGYDGLSLSRCVTPLNYCPEIWYGTALAVYTLELE
jgi:hypothetical protein